MSSENTPSLELELDVPASTRMVQQLLAALRRTHDDVACLETHISWVLLAENQAWKIKKPLSLGFLDYGTLARRQWGCEEELRINRRTAPQLYLDVVPITGSVEQPELGGSGPLLGHAVHMRRFAQEALLGRLAQEGALAPELIDALAQQVAAMHAGAGVATPAQPHGAPHAMHHAVADNFGSLRQMVGCGPLRALVRELLRWTNRQHKRLLPLFAQRLQQGFVRECHGDLHLGNIVLHEGVPLPFDAIEFDPDLRWTDIQADIAFLVMDLLQRGRSDLAWCALNGWLEHSGDYAGLALLPYYMVYRALVRAKVAGLRAGQAQGAERDAILQEMREYLELALRCSRPRALWLWITMGVSGSGKSSQTQSLIAHTGVIRLRADVERKRLHGLTPGASSHAAGQDIYTSDASRRTFAHLSQLATAVLQAGFPVLLDATFIRRDLRDTFRELARHIGVPFGILAFELSEVQLRERVQLRHHQGGDASEADLQVLQSQLAAREPLAADERSHAVMVDSSQPVDWSQVLRHTAWEDALDL